MYAFLPGRHAAAFYTLAFVAVMIPISAVPAVADARHNARSPGFFNFFSRWQQPPLQPQQRQPRHSRGASVSTACLPASIKSALADVQRKFGPITVVSAHRGGARIAGTRRASLHATCQAADFRPAKGTYAAVAAHLRQNWSGGLGTYSAGHIHIDTGENYRWHHGAGRRAYASARRR